ncbi:anaphase-promoting complex subunit 5 isoform X1 [Macrobrachium rosenbergii]|uniref:anaphase-promoting complex subunit 5 isoform X1 n=1 Tax=Macrobrachium rosenbergii TaxID=79674 RepID=UPI0034D6E9B2
MIGGMSGPLSGSGSRKEKDVVTPHSISILLFIERYARLRPKYWDCRPPDANTVPPDITPQERKATCLMTVRLVQGGDMALSELLQVLESASLLPHHVTTFMTALHQMYCSGIDSVLNLFDSVEKFSAQDQIRAENFPCLWTSVVGLYVRRLNLSFRRLSFSQVTSLYQQFRDYYEECFATNSTQMQQHIDTDIQMAADESNIAEDTDSDTKMEDMMEESKDEDIGADITACSEEVLAINSSSAREPQPMLLLPHANQRDTDNVGHSNHSTRQQAELFISRQATLLQINETAALPPQKLQEKIRQLVQHNPDLAEAHYLSYLNCIRTKEFSGAVHSLLHAYDSQLMNRDSSRLEDQGRGFRYAALNVAALHAQFGHKKVGLAILKEAIRLAQECSDHACLQHALSWLYVLSPTQKSQLMRRSIIKSSELSLSYLSSLGRLNHAAQLAYTRASPSHLLQSISRAEALNCQNSLVSLQHCAWGLRAALWANWGISNMALLTSQILLHLNTHHPSNIGIFHSSHPSCNAICMIAIGLANLGDYQLAGEVLQHAQERFPPHGQFSSTWMFAQTHITLNDLLLQGCWTEAQSVITSMATCNPLEAKIRQCELLVAKGELTKVWELLGDLREDPELVGELRVRMLLIESCAAVMGGGCAVAIPVIVEALTNAREHHLTYLEAIAHLHTANIQLQLGRLSEAEASVRKGLGVVLAGGSVYDQARARLVAAKLQISRAVGQDRDKKLMKIALCLELAGKLFLKVKAYHKVRETLYLKARLYHEIGCTEERNKCALEFRQFELQHPCQSFQLSVNTF